MAHAAAKLSELQNCASTFSDLVLQRDFASGFTDVANELRDKSALDDRSYVPDVRRPSGKCLRALGRGGLHFETKSANRWPYRKAARSLEADRTIRTKNYASVNPSDRSHLFTFTQ
jgi:hypothetical protein